MIRSEARGQWTGTWTYARLATSCASANCGYTRHVAMLHSRSPNQARPTNLMLLACCSISVVAVRGARGMHRLLGVWMIRRQGKAWLSFGTSTQNSSIRTSGPMCATSQVGDRASRHWGLWQSRIWGYAYDSTCPRHFYTRRSDRLGPAVRWP